MTDDRVDRDALATEQVVLQPLSASSVSATLRKLGYRTVAPEQRHQREGMYVSKSGLPRQISVDIGLAGETETTRVADRVARSLRDAGYTVEHDGGRRMTVYRVAVFDPALADTPIGRVRHAVREHRRWIENDTGRQLTVKIGPIDFVVIRYSPKTGRLTKLWRSGSANSTKPGVGLNEVEATGELLEQALAWVVGDQSPSTPSSTRAHEPESAPMPDANAGREDRAEIPGLGRSVRRTHDQTPGRPTKPPLKDSRYGIPYGRYIVDDRRYWLKYDPNYVTGYLWRYDQTRKKWQRDIDKPEHDRVIATLQSEAYSQAIQYGMLTGHCSKCGNKLSRDDSKKLGMGEDCARESFPDEIDHIFDSPNLGST
ncbi:DUF6011 domain-containing protein [Nocardia sp. NPDC050435]|uniref:DUF6011 domain-containing protein n=1 Tax=Nocardia sp. NPDC050435 TaxID=3155040 RepID=UPI003410836B